MKLNADISQGLVRVLLSVCVHAKIEVEECHLCQ